MDSKPIFRIGVFAALVVICGLCGLTAYATFDWLTGSVPSWDVWNTRAQSGQATETLAFAASPNLVISTDAGDVEVTAAEVEQIEVELVKTSYGDTIAEAEAGAAALAVRVTESGGELRLEYDKPDELGFSLRGAADTIDFIVRVPAETSVDLETSFGKITVSGLTGDALLESQFGEIEVEDLTGALDAGSSNASVTLKRVQAGESDVSVETNFGRIEMEDVTAGSVTVKSSNGPITAVSITALESILVENQFGDIEISGVNAVTLEIRNENGRIVVDGGQVGDLLSATNRFGEVMVTGVQAPAYELWTSNGDLTVEAAAGRLTLENAFGDISVTASSGVTLDIQGSNGSIRFTGPLAPTAHSIRNAFGDITLIIPGDSAFDLLLETDFGEIRSEIPLSLTGALDSGSENNHWEAAVNGGGPLLEATTSNGDVVIQILPEPAGE